MALDKDKIDDAALALLYLTLHDHDRAWKGMSWDVLDRVAAKKEFDLRSRRKGESGWFFAPEGLGRAKALFKEDVQKQ